jgi:predicted N-acetyltransferase YhbS
MQIRVANRQDEPAIRAIVNEARALRGEPEIDLGGADADLNNIDAKYFWHDGIFVVAEESDAIIGLVGARRDGDSETLRLVRLAVKPEHRKQGVGRRLVDTVFFFARNLEYEMVMMTPKCQGLDPDTPLFGFDVNTSDPDEWIYKVPAFIPAKPDAKSRETQLNA